MRGLLRGCSAIVAWMILAVVAGGCASQPMKVPAESLTGRTAQSDTLIDQGWRFIREDVASAQQPKFDDAAWEAVEIPHTWNNFDGQEGNKNYYRGPAWYRRHVQVEGGKSYFLRFDAAATVAEVYANGLFLGSHRGNFGAFCFDATAALHKGDNVVAVRVDNTREEDVPPLAGDFTIFGGLYRDAHLLTLNTVSINPADDASPGVYLKLDKLHDRSAEVRVTTKLRNGSAANQQAKVACTIFDAEGKVVASDSTKDVAVSNDGTAVVQTIKIDNPHLWAGRADPYLYRAQIDVEQGGKVVDQIVQPLGLRYFRIDPEKGFFLDGQHYPLHGVNRHQDRLDKGWSIGNKEHEQDIAIMLEMGCTGLRLSHYQHAEMMYQLCDRNGLVVWAEDGLVNQIRKTPAFYANARQQVRELIKQNYNHPSIVMWSLFNELGFTKSRDPSDWELVEQLNAEAHELDETRLTTAASHLLTAHPINWITDVIGFNRYPGWYSGKLTDWPKLLDAMHAVHPDRPIGISEYGAGGSIYMHEQPATKPGSARGWWRSEEYQCLLHEAAWRAMKDRPWLWGTFLWAGFDFASAGRREGDQPGRNDKGLVTYDRKIKKDAFYFYQANWTQAPMVHLTASRFAERPAGPTQVKVYSNCDTVELFLDDNSVGTASGDTAVFLWDVTLHPGENHVKAVARKGGDTLTDEVVWQASPTATTRYTTTQPWPGAPTGPASRSDK